MGEVGGSAGAAVGARRSIWILPHAAASSDWRSLALQGLHLGPECGLALVRHVAQIVLEWWLAPPRQSASNRRQIKSIPRAISISRPSKLKSVFSLIALPVIV